MYLRDMSLSDGQSDMHSAYVCVCMHMLVSYAENLAKLYCRLHAHIQHTEGCLFSTSVSLQPLELFHKTTRVVAVGLTRQAGMQVFMLSADAILNIDTLSELLASGHSRVPVHVPGNRYLPAPPTRPPSPPLPRLPSLHPPIFSTLACSCSLSGHCGTGGHMSSCTGIMQQLHCIET